MSDGDREQMKGGLLREPQRFWGWEVTAVDGEVQKQHVAITLQE